jgi:isoleucyl-tRNA synthetase
VRYKAVADWGVLGKKLRKDLGRVRNALPKISSAEIKEYVQSGKIAVDGIPLVEGDLTVQRYLELPEGSETKYATHTDNDVVIRLEIQIHDDLQNEWLAREMTNRVQKLRKKAGLQAVDEVDVFYAFKEGSGADLVAAVEHCKELVVKTVGGLPQDVKARKPDATVLIEEEQEIADVKFTLSLARS